MVLSTVGLGPHLPGSKLVELLGPWAHWAQVLIEGDARKKRACGTGDSFRFAVVSESV